MANDSSCVLLQVSTESLQGQRDPLAGEQQAGVFVGIQQMEYGGLASPYLTNVGPYSATGTPFSVAAGRISFTFGLKGPAVSSSKSFPLSR